jgi:hypothetical protein
MKILRWSLLAILMSWTGQALHAQSIADTARQERERQKKAQVKAVFIDTAGAISTAGTTVATVAATSAVAAQAAKVTGPTDNQGRDEKYWRATFAQARANLKRAEDRLHVLDLKMSDLNARLLREGIYTREMDIRAEIDKTRGDQVGAQKDVSDARQKIADLEDELRRSGGLPGWAR